MSEIDAAELLSQIAYTTIRFPAVFALLNATALFVVARAASFARPWT